MTTPRKQLGPRMVRYDTATVERYQAELKPEHFTILMIASGAANDYAAISAALNGLNAGTVKSRLNRARHAMAVLVERDRAKEAA